jgi:hypothetical protein
MEAPSIIILEDEEKFQDTNGNCIEIEVRGEREHNNIYFKVKDVSKNFNIINLADTLTKNSTNYEKELHYNFFYLFKPR